MKDDDGRWSEGLGSERISVCVSGSVSIWGLLLQANVTGDYVDCPKTLSA